MSERAISIVVCVPADEAGKDPIECHEGDGSPTAEAPRALVVTGLRHQRQSVSR